MQARFRDGSLLLSELRDDAVLRSNIVPNEVAGMEAVRRCIGVLDALCPTQKLVFRRNHGNREIICTEARLVTGEETQITTVGLRDDTGWICAVFSDHGPEAAAIKLRQLYAERTA